VEPARDDLVGYLPIPGRPEERAQRASRGGGLDAAGLGEGAWIELRTACDTLRADELTGDALGPDGKVAPEGGGLGFADYCSQTVA
jgi:hypothetical protein